MPELEDVNPKKKGKTKNSGTPIVFISIVLIVLGGLGFGIQYAITEMGIFEQKQVVVTEPPVPEFEPSNVPEEEEAEPNSEGYFVGEDDVSTTHTTQDVPINIEEPNTDVPEAAGGKLSEEQLSELLASIGVVLKAVEEQKLMIEALGTEHTKIKSKVDSLTEYSFTNGDAVSKNVRDNTRWLTGISNQLRDIGISVQNANESFPLVVYHSNIWGNETYLTVAPKEHPDQTRFMKVGDFTGKWKLITIGEATAKFEHLEGNVKELRLQ